MRKTGEIGDCWKQIGVWGDSSCPELQRFVHCKNCSIFSEAGRSLLDREPPADYLQEWKEILARPKETDNIGLVSVVIFRIGEKWFAMDTKYFREVTELRPVHTVPHHSRGLLRGLVNIRGEVHLCCSLSLLLSIEEKTETTTGRMIVIERNKERWVIEVDQVEGTHNVNVTSESNSLQNTFKWQNRDVFYLHADLLFDQMGRQRL